MGRAGEGVKDDEERFFTSFAYALDILRDVDIILAVLAASAFLAAAILFFARIAAAASRRREASGGAKVHGVRTCPLCSSEMGSGERVSSKLFPGKGDRIMHIFGCPSCWPPSLSRKRICPVCGREISREGWVVARYFDRTKGADAGPKAHVHVLGCTECRK